MKRLGSSLGKYLDEPNGLDPTKSSITPGGLTNVSTRTWSESLVDDCTEVLDIQSETVDELIQNHGLLEESPKSGLQIRKSPDSSVYSSLEGAENLHIQQLGSLRTPSSEKSARSIVRKNSERFRSESQICVEDMLLKLLQKTDETNSRLAALEQHGKESRDRLLVLEKSVTNSSAMRMQMNVEWHPPPPPEPDNHAIPPPKEPKTPYPSSAMAPCPLPKVSENMTEGGKTAFCDPQAGEDVPLPPSIPEKLQICDNPDKQDPSEEPNAAASPNGSSVRTTAKSRWGSLKALTNVKEYNSEERKASKDEASSTKWGAVKALALASNSEEQNGTTKDESSEARSKAAMTKWGVVTTVARLAKSPQTNKLKNSPSFEAQKRTSVSGQLKRKATIAQMEQAGGVEKFVRHDYFTYFFGFMIIVNAICIGAQADHVAKNPFEPVPGHFKTLETFFCILFSIELILRVGVERSEFFFTREWKWNAFDILIVLLALMEEIFKLMGDSRSSNLLFMRIIRVLRVVRIIRLVRVLHTFRELRVLINSILGSMNSLMWTILLLLVIMYICAVYLCQVVADHRMEWADKEVDEAHAEDLEAMEEMYGSVLRGLYSLYQAMSGGADWGDVASPLVNQISGFFAPVFCMYIAFSVFAVLNVVTGVFVNEAMIMAAKDQELAIEEELSREGSEIDDFSRMFHEADADGNGLVNWDEMAEHLEDSRVKAYFKALNLDVAEAKMLFRLLDLDGSGEISIDEFVTGCIKVKGQAKGIDIHCLRYETKKLIKELQKVADRVGVGDVKHQSKPGDSPSNRKRRPSLGSENSGNSNKGHPSLS